jgi:hypothetical protein
MWDLDPLSPLRNTALVGGYARLHRFQARMTGETSEGGSKRGLMNKRLFYAEMNTKPYVWERK